MTKRFFSIACGLLLLFTGSMQAQEGFNPTLPPDPSMPEVPVVKYPLTVTCMPAAAGTAAGKGSYAEGTVVTVSTSANAEYTFSHWTLNGERYEAATSNSFSFTTIGNNMDFVAVYDYTPTPFEPESPNDPSAEIKSRLYLQSSPTGVCTFNRTSGAKWTVDSYVLVNVTNVNQSYEFKGWYLDGVLLTTEKSFNHQIPYNDVTLVAHFERLPDPEPEPEEPFDPANPNDPNMSDKQEDAVETHARGDVNKDGEVNVIDATLVIKAYLDNSTAELGKSADINGDSEINVIDATLIINSYLNEE